MKRSLILCIIVVFVIATMIFIVIWAGGGFRGNNQKDETPVAELEYELSLVHRVPMTSSTTIRGKVTGNANGYTEYVDLIIRNTDTFIVKAILGKDLEKGEVIYSLNGDDILCNGNMKYVDYEEYSNDENGKAIRLTFLDYDSLLIEAYIDEAWYSEISYDSRVLIERNGEKYESKIRSIGYEIIGKSIMITAALPTKMLPGSEVTMTITSAVPREALWVSEDFVFWDGSSYYVLVCSEQNPADYRRVEISVGGVSLYSDGGYSTSYFEILDGIEPETYICREYK